MADCRLILFVRISVKEMERIVVDNNCLFNMIAIPGLWFNFSHQIAKWHRVVESLGIYSGIYNLESFKISEKMYCG